MNISSFINWFINQFINIGSQLLSKLDMIQLRNNVSLLDFIIAITIIGMFIPIILTIPNNANKWSKSESKKREKSKK